MLPGRHDRWQRDPRIGMLVIVAGFGIAGFLALAAAIMLAPAFVRFDLAASAAIRSIQVPGLEAVAIVVSKIGDFWPMFALTTVTGVALLLRGRTTSSITLVLTMLSGTVFGQLMKALFTRVRPALDVARIPIPATYSFPSGHALSSLLFFGSVVMLILLNERRLRVAAFESALCLLMPVAIAFSRVYLGVHYLGDIIGSWLLGIGWLALSLIVSARWGAGSESQAGANAVKRVG